MVKAEVILRPWIQLADKLCTQRLSYANNALGPASQTGTPHFVSVIFVIIM